MKNSHLLVLALLVLIIFNLLLIHQLLSERQHKNILPHDIIKENQLREQLLYSISMDEYEINLSIPSDSENDRPVLCYYASDIHCHSCVDSLFSILCNVGKKYDGFNIILLAKYNNKNNLNLFLRQNPFRGTVLDINKLNNEIFKSEYPIIFVYHPNEHKIGEIFRPLMSDIETTRRYLDIIFKKYSNNKQ